VACVAFGVFHFPRGERENIMCEIEETVQDICETFRFFFSAHCADRISSVWTRLVNKFLKIIFAEFLVINASETVE
jgi:hypothetical protein